MTQEMENMFLKDENERLKELLKGTIRESGYLTTSLSGRCWEINTSSILSRLIKEAGRCCNYYASDLFIDWSCIDRELRNGSLESGSYVFAFRNSGVDHKEFYEHNKDVPYYYKAVWKLDITVNENKMEMVLHR